MFKNITYVFEQKQNYLALLNERLKARSPLRSLDHGTAYIEKNGQKIHSIEDIGIDDDIELFMKEGKVITKVLRKEVF